MFPRLQNLQEAFLQLSQNRIDFNIQEIADTILGKFKKDNYCLTENLISNFALDERHPITHCTAQEIKVLQVSYNHLISFKWFLIFTQLLHEQFKLFNAKSIILSSLKCHLIILYTLVVNSVNVELFNASHSFFFQRKVKELNEEKDLYQKKVLAQANLVHEINDNVKAQQEKYQVTTLQYVYELL